MGRRAKKAPVQTKKRTTLSKRFKCPFCANNDVVECKMDNRAGIGSLECRLCGASYQMPIHHLHEPIDVFSEWLDDCESAQTGRPTEQQEVPVEEEDEESDEDETIPEASGLNNNSNNNRSAAHKSSLAAKKTAPAAATQPSYSALGLDDSDDSDDEDDE